ncbi:MAG: hypothetical protein Q7J66_00020 [Hydrogenophaga sp.]|nr:hypothetical protein [Hydrogenophaga sp.]
MRTAHLWAVFNKDLSDALAERIYIQLGIFVGLVSGELLLVAPGLPDFGEARFFRSGSQERHSTSQC